MKTDNKTKKYSLFKKLTTLVVFIFFILCLFSIKTDSVFAEECVIQESGTDFIPSGKQDDTWFKNSNIPEVGILTKTSGCKNKELILNIYAEKTLSKTMVFSQKITVPNSEYFNARFKTGTVGCSNLFNPDCTYYFEFKNPENKSYLFKDKKLTFNCESDCTNNQIWSFLSVTEISATPIVLGNCGDAKDNDNDNLIDGKDPDCLDSGVGFGPPLYMSTNLESGRYTTNEQMLTAINERKKEDDAKNNKIGNQESGYGIQTQQEKTFDSNYHLLAPIPGLPETIDGTKQLGDYVNAMFKIFLGLCAALAVIMIIFYGIQWMGTDSIFSKTEAKQNIGGAIGGLLLALGAWLILNTINPDLLGGTLNIKQATIALEGDANAPVEINRGDANKLGILCDHSGGKNDIPATAKSFDGKMTYSQDIPKGQIVNNKIKLDCSGYINYVLQCVGINTTSMGINSGTSTIFSNAEKVDPTRTGPSSINGVDLKVGDLVGWKAGDNTDKYSKSGHVMIYIGNGLVTDSHSGTSNAFGSFDLTKYKDQIKFVKRL